MEIQTKNGSKTLLKNGPQIDFGRGLGFDSSDRTVSRRHVSFRIDRNDQTRVHLQVIGKNPIWVHDAKSDEIRVYRSSEKGVLQPGDSFCVSAKKPVWFNLKRIESEEEDTSGIEFGDELAESLQKSPGLGEIEDVELEHVDFSNLDPVKDFGFVVLGHEFDRYPKKAIRETKNWDWFLEDHGGQSDDDDDDDNGESERKRKRKRKKGGGNDVHDEDWTGESEEDAAELINKSRKFQKPKYSTRSKDLGKNSKSATSTRQATPRSKTPLGDEDEDEEDDDVTLGGFIVGDEDLEEEDEGGFEEDEEEFEDNDDEEK